MAFFPTVQAHGDVVNLSKTHPKHMGGMVNGNTPAGGESFQDPLMRALNGVNQLQLTGDQLGTQMITDPDSVEAHDVTIAMAQANLALSMTKAVLDRAINAYTSIINIR